LWIDGAVSGVAMGYHASNMAMDCTIADRSTSGRERKVVSFTHGFVHGFVIGAIEGNNLIDRPN
jgi:hypothetical protein